MVEPEHQAWAEPGPRAEPQKVGLQPRWVLQQLPGLEPRWAVRRVEQEAGSVLLEAGRVRMGSAPDGVACQLLAPKLQGVVRQLPALVKETVPPVTGAVFEYLQLTSPHHLEEKAENSRCSYAASWVALTESDAVGSSITLQ